MRHRDDAAGGEEHSLPPDLAAALAALEVAAQEAAPAEAQTAVIRVAAVLATLGARMRTLTSPNGHGDEALDVKEAARRLGVTVSYLRHEGDRLHSEMVAGTGEGFIVPWSEGTV